MMAPRYASDAIRLWYSGVPLLSKGSSSCTVRFSGSSTCTFPATYGVRISAGSLLKKAVTE